MQNVKLWEERSSVAQVSDTTKLNDVTKAGTKKFFSFIRICTLVIALYKKLHPLYAQRIRITDIAPRAF